MAELIDPKEFKKTTRSILFTDVYECPRCRSAKVEVSTSFKEARIVKMFRCLNCDHSWTNIDSVTESEKLS